MTNKTNQTISLKDLVRKLRRHSTVAVIMAATSSAILCAVLIYMLLPVPDSHAAGKDFLEEDIAVTNVSSDFEASVQKAVEDLEAELNLQTEAEQQSRTELSRQLDALTKQLDTISNGIANDLTTLSAKDTKTQSIQNTLKTLQDRTRETAEKIQLLKQDLDQNQDLTLQDQRQRFQEITREMEKIRSEHGNSVESLRELIEKLKQDNHDSNSDLISRLQSIYDNMHLQQELAIKEIRILQSGMEKTQQDLLARIEARQKALEDSLRQSQESIERGQSELAQGQSTLAQGQSTLAQGQSTLVQGQSTLAQGQSTLAQGQSTLAQGQSDLAGIINGNQASLAASIKANQDSLTQGQDALAKGQADLAGNMKSGQDALAKGQSDLAGNMKSGQDALAKGQSDLAGIINGNQASLAASMKANQDSLTQGQDALTKGQSAISDTLKTNQDALTKGQSAISDTMKSGQDALTKGQSAISNTMKANQDNLSARFDRLDQSVSQVFQSVNSGKSRLSALLTTGRQFGDGYSAASTASILGGNTPTFENLENAIRATWSGDADASQVLEGHTFSNAATSGIRGTMPDHGSLATALTPDQNTLKLDAGYYSGITVSANFPKLKTTVHHHNGDCQEIPITRHKTHTEFEPDSEGDVYCIYCNQKMGFWIGETYHPIMNLFPCVEETIGTWYSCGYTEGQIIKAELDYTTGGKVI